MLSWFAQWQQGQQKKHFFCLFLRGIMISEFQIRYSIQKQYTCSVFSCLQYGHIVFILNPASFISYSICFVLFILTPSPLRLIIVDNA